MVEVSIVIATYNRAEHLLRTLRSLLTQSLEPSLWEVVAVNNNSSDNTRELFEAFAAKHHGYNMRMVDESSQGLSHARNKGIAESRGDIIVIIDDDQIVNREFLEEYYRFFSSHPNIAAAGGKIVPLYEYELPRWASPYAQRPIAGTLNMGSAIKPFRKGFPGGGNMALRRSAINRYGAFNTALGRTGTKLMAGEEKDLFDRLARGGERVYYIPNAIVEHIIPKSRMTKEYFDRVTTMTGASERVRTLSISRKAYFKRLGQEVVKWCGAMVLAIGYLLNGEPQKGMYLLRMRRNTTKGLLKS